MESVSIIIPCYNEEPGLMHLKETLDPILEKLSENREIELIFVDDGSKDRTNELLWKNFGDREYVKIIKHEKNMNLGAAMRTGFAAATGDIVITMDSDCTYDPEGIFTMLDMLDSETDIVTASPYHKDGGVENVPKYRLFLSKGICTIYSALTGTKIDTYTALFRVQRKEVVKNIHFENNDFLATAEQLIYAMLHGYKVKEYPTVLYVRKYGESKMKLAKVIKSHAKFVGKVGLAKMQGKFNKDFAQVKL